MNPKIYRVSKKKKRVRKNVTITEIHFMHILGLPLFPHPLRLATCKFNVKDDHRG